MNVPQRYLPARLTFSLALALACPLGVSRLSARPLHCGSRLQIPAVSRSCLAVGPQCSSAPHHVPFLCPSPHSPIDPLPCCARAVRGQSRTSRVARSTL